MLAARAELDAQRGRVADVAARGARVAAGAGVGRHVVAALVAVVEREGVAIGVGDDVEAPQRLARVGADDDLRALTGDGHGAGRGRGGEQYGDSQDSRARDHAWGVPAASPRQTV